MTRLTKNEAGFTLIELLIVMGTIGALAAISVQSWSVYKQRAFNTTAQADLKNGLISLETYIDDNDEYPECEGDVCVEDLAGFSFTPGVYIAFVSTGGLSGTLTSCYPGKGNLAFIRPSITDVTIEVPIAACGGS